MDAAVAAQHKLLIVTKKRTAAAVPLPDPCTDLSETTNALPCKLPADREQGGGVFLSNRVVTAIVAIVVTVAQVACSLGMEANNTVPDRDAPPRPDQRSSSSAAALKCDGHRVARGADLHALIAEASNETFCLAAGTYDVGSAPLAPGGNVVIWGATGRRSRDGVISAPTKIVGSGPVAIITAGENNTFRWLDISGSSGGPTCQPDCGRGIRANAGTIVIFTRIHHNSNTGIGGGVPARVTVRFSELDHNGTDAFEGTYGGVKHAATENGGILEVTDSFVHDNIGVGLWGDRCLMRMVIKRNLVVGNSRDGIRWETDMPPADCPNTTTRSAVIHLNEVHGNGTDPTESGDAGIKIRNSPNADVAYNRTSLNAEQGIRVIHDDRTGSTVGNTIRNNIAPDGIDGCSLAIISCSGNTVP
jgi:hypothetical protein